MCLLVSGIALTMSPMTAAIMSSVPPRRAGAGSAMNDATRELGASLGIAVLGSLAATRYDNSLNHALTALTAGAALAGPGLARGRAQRRRQACAPRPADALTIAAQHSFVNGVHMAVTGGAILVGCSAIAVARWLPATSRTKA